MEVVAKLVRIMWVPLLLSVAYTGWVFWQRHPSAPAPGQLGAARSILQIGMKLREASDLAERVAALEARLRAREGGDA